MGKGGREGFFVGGGGEGGISEGREREGGKCSRGESLESGRLGRMKERGGVR